jgi:hypothetical protein
MHSALRDDALTTIPTGVALRIGLPWIRSLPIACLRGIEVAIDDVPVAPIRVRLGDRLLAPEELGGETSWWFAQDRVVLEAGRSLEAGLHDVEVTFRLLIPYLMAGPDGGALELPQRLERSLLLDHAPVASVSRDAA